jgi:acyl-CoA reductase-like NAD-dependent aldehyde dehydrogenase
VNSAFLNSGQTCTAWTRLLVPRSLAAEAVDLAVATTEKLTLGDQFDPSTKLGPLVSGTQLATVRSYVQGALRSGARAAIGGAQPPDGPRRGHFFGPTILIDVTADMRIAREEVFGPVLCVMTYDTEEEAIEIANGTDYGLSAAVWSQDADRAARVASRLRAGQVDINGGRFNIMAPQGGYKKSGIGRELGKYGMEEFLELKALQR